VLLAASVVCNVVLVRRRSHAAETAASSSARSAAPVAAAVAAPRPPSLVTARLGRFEMEPRLVRIEARIAALQSPTERWKKGQPTPEVEATVRPYLDQVFAKVGSYKLDCRGGACRIDTATSMDEWMEPLQSGYPDRALYDMSFERYAYIAPHEASEGAGMWLWWAITMKAYDAAEACMKASTAHGDLTINFDLDDKTRRVAVRIGGSLANDPVGQCVRRALEDAVAVTTVPPDAHAVLGQDVRFELPLAEPPH
jgi:hypothetical protein